MNEDQKKYVPPNILFVLVSSAILYVLVDGVDPRHEIEDQIDRVLRRVHQVNCDDYVDENVVPEVFFYPRL
jgi:hypothetical protein